MLLVSVGFAALNPHQKIGPERHWIARHQGRFLVCINHSVSRESFIRLAQALDVLTRPGHCKVVITGLYQNINWIGFRLLSMQQLVIVGVIMSHPS